MFCGQPNLATHAQRTAALGCPTQPAGQLLAPRIRERLPVPVPRPAPARRTASHYRVFHVSEARRVQCVRCRRACRHTAGLDRVRFLSKEPGGGHASAPRAAAAAVGATRTAFGQSASRWAAAARAASPPRAARAPAPAAPRHAARRAPTAPHCARSLPSARPARRGGRGGSSVACHRAASWMNPQIWRFRPLCTRFLGVQ